MDFEFSLTVDDEGKVPYSEVQGVLKILETYVKKLGIERTKRKHAEARYELALAHLAAQQRTTIDLQATNIDFAKKLNADVLVVTPESDAKTKKQK